MTTPSAKQESGSSGNGKLDTTKSGNGYLTEFAERFDQALVQRNLSLVRFAKLTGISKGSLSQYLNGQADPSATRVRVIAEALEVSVEWLLTGREGAPAVPASAAQLLPVQRYLDHYDAVHQETTRHGRKIDHRLVARLAYLLTRDAVGEQVDFARVREYLELLG